MKTKATPKSLKKPKSTVKPNKTKTIQLDDAVVIKYLQQGYLSSKLTEELWSAIIKKQQLISCQMEESEKRFFRRMEEKNRFIEESEKKFFRRVEEKNQQIKEHLNKYENEPKTNNEAFNEPSRQLTRTKQLINKKGKLHDSSGNLDDHLICLAIINQFRGKGYYFDDISPGGRIILDDKGNEKTELGIILENIHCLIAVEVIANPRIKDIESHINKLKILREHRNKYKDFRKIHGAIAGGQFKSHDKQTGLEAGLFIFKQTGKTLKIDIPDNFIPQNWQL